MKYFLIILFFLSACGGANTSRKSGYRIVGKSGKVIYFDKKRPDFNAEQMKKQQTKINFTSTNTNNKAVAPAETFANKKAEKQVVETKNKKAETTKSVNFNSNKEELKSESNAYNLKTVIDTVVKNEDINEIAKTVDTNIHTTKTIKDYEYIPNGYFEDTPKAQRLTVEQNAMFIKTGGRTQVVPTKTSTAKVNTAKNTDTNTNKNKFGSLFSSIKINKQSTKTKEKKPVVQQQNTTTKGTANNNLQKKINNASQLKNSSTTANNGLYTLIKNKFYVQLGIFSNETTAINIARKNNIDNKDIRIIRADCNKRTCYKATIGYFNTRAEAEAVKVKIIEKGGPKDAFSFKY